MDTQTKQQIEQRIEYRGFILEITQEPKSQMWMLHYRLNIYSPITSKFRWKTAQEAEAHGKRMIDSLIAEG